MAGPAPDSGTTTPRISLADTEECRYGDYFEKLSFWKELSPQSSKITKSLSIHLIAIAL
jgi:hypothetical protein